MDVLGEDITKEGIPVGNLRGLEVGLGFGVMAERGRGGHVGRRNVYLRLGNFTCKHTKQSQMEVSNLVKNGASAENTWIQVWKTNVLIGTSSINSLTLVFKIYSVPDCICAGGKAKG